jgi:hypothetical protein
MPWSEALAFMRALSLSGHSILGNLFMQAGHSIRDSIGVRV